MNEGDHDARGSTPPLSGHTTEARSLRLLLAVLRTETKLVRLRRALNRKYSPDQPRAPAGQSDGGRWCRMAAPAEMPPAGRRAGAGPPSTRQNRFRGAATHTC